MVKVSAEEELSHKRHKKHKVEINDFVLFVPFYGSIVLLESH